MSTATLYGQISRQMVREFQVKTETFQRHSHLINRFGDLIKPLGLTPHVRPESDGRVALVALMTRGEDFAPLRADLQARNAHIGTPIRPTTQFQDEFEIWTVDVRLDGIDFTLVYYTPR